MFIPLPPDRGAARGLPPVCGAAGPLPGGRSLYVIKISVLSHGGPYRPAGGRQAPPNIKAEVPPPAFAANNIHRRKKERRGVREGVATAKPCRILDPNRR